MELWQDFTIPLEVDDILRGEGMDPEAARRRKPVLAEVAERARDLGMVFIHPLALTQTQKVTSLRHERLMLEGGTALTGPLVARLLGGAQSVTACLCTIGTELEEHVATINDPLLALALDGLGNAVVEMVAEQVCGRIGNAASAQGQSASTPLSPGAPEWPVETGQPQIFSILDPRQAGIRLTEGGMMIPRKSVSFVVGQGNNLLQVDTCEYCNLKETCRYRNRTG